KGPALPVHAPVPAAAAPPHPAPPHAAPGPVVTLDDAEATGIYLPGSGTIEAAPGYPNELFPTRRRAHLVVAACDQTGVTLAFDSLFLESTGFRLSMPVRCVYTGQTNRADLLARPLSFCDRSQAIVRSAQQVEEGHEVRLSEGQVLEDILHTMGFI